MLRRMRRGHKSVGGIWIPVYRKMVGPSDGILTEDEFYFITEDGDYLVQETGENGYEDFTTYTPVDEEFNQTIETNKLTLTDLHTEHVEEYLYKDFGADYFSEDFEIQFEFCVTDCEHGQDTSDMFGIIGTCNTLGVRDGWDAGPWVNWRPGVELGTINLHCGDDSWSSSYMIFNAAPGTIFYCTLERISAIAPLECTVQLSVYSDANRTIRMNTATGEPSVTYGEDDVPSETGFITYQYLEIGLAERLAFDDTAYGSYYVQNVEIISH